MDRSRNIKLTLQYDGTDFHGFELQPGKRTVRSLIEKALFKLFKEKIKIISASRTDSGVHALGQVVGFKLKNPIPVARIPVALNTFLPEDLRVIEAEEMPEEFNPRFDTRGKEYEYLIYDGPVMPPHLRRIAWHVRPGLDIAAMQKAAKCLVGKHDFSSFCAARGDDKNFFRNLKKIDIRKSKIEIWEGMNYEVCALRFIGDGFLYKMVRNLVGTLVEAGLGKLSPEDIKRILKAKDRKLAGRTAPAHGLCLVKVCYN